MTEEKLKNYIKMKYGNIANFCKEIGMANSTFATIMTNGIQCANVKNIIKICQALDISADELAKGNIVPVKSDDPVMEYAVKLSSLPESARENAFMYIDFLLSQSTPPEKRLNLYRKGLMIVNESEMEEWFKNGTPMKGVKPND